MGKSKLLLIFIIARLLILTVIIGFLLLGCAILDQENVRQDPKIIARNFLNYMKKGDFENAYAMHLKKLSLKEIRSGPNSIRAHRENDTSINFSEFVTDYRRHVNLLKKISIGKSKIDQLKGNKFTTVIFETNLTKNKIVTTMKKQNNTWYVFSFDIWYLD